MTTSRFMFVAAIAGAVAGFGVMPTASAAPRLVTVHLNNIRDVLAADLDVDVELIPVTVVVPISVAANVCGIAVNVLAQEIEDTGTAQCEAESSSEALEKIVALQL